MSVLLGAFVDFHVQISPKNSKNNAHHVPTDQIDLKKPQRRDRDVHLSPPLSLTRLALAHLLSLCFCPPTPAPAVCRPLCARSLSPSLSLSACLPSSLSSLSIFLSLSLSFLCVCRFFFSLCSSERVGRQEAAQTNIDNKDR